MKKKTVVTICIILASLMVLGIAVPAIVGGIWSSTAYAAKSTSQLNEELEESKKEQQEIKDKLDETTAQKNEAQERKDQLDSEIDNLNSDIYDINSEITKIEAEISQKEAEIDAINADIEENDELLKKRLRVMYEQGSASYLEVLFSATSFSDLLVRIDMVQQLYAHDQKLIEELNVQKAEVDEARQEIEIAKQEREKMKASLESRKDEVELKTAESEELIEQLEKDEATLQREYEEREKENEEILNEIKLATQRAQAAQNSGGSSSAAPAVPYMGGKLGWPCALQGTITSRFGNRTLRGIPDFHTGLDIAVPTGTPVYASADGVVISSGWRNSYGYCVTINHGSITTLYAHNSSLVASVGQQVKRGQVIAYSGSTGNSTGPHVHLGVINNSTGQYVDPSSYLW